MSYYKNGKTKQCSQARMRRNLVGKREDLFWFNIKQR